MITFAKKIKDICCIYILKVAFCNKNIRTMNTAVRLSESMVTQAKVYSKAMHRSVSKQIEYWASIGRVAEEHPDLPYSFIQDILVSQQEVAAKQLVPYQFASP